MRRLRTMRIQARYSVDNCLIFRIVVVSITRSLKLPIPAKLLQWMLVSPQRLLQLSKYLIPSVITSYLSSLALALPHNEQSLPASITSVYRKILLDLPNPDRRLVAFCFSCWFSALFSWI